MAAPAATTTDLGIGARLRAARERAGLSSIQAAERLHMEPKMIEALDGEEFAALGAPVYVRGHLRRYAELVGESPGELLERYAASIETGAAPDLRRISRAEEPVEASRQIAVPIAIGIVVIAIVGAISWALRSARPPAPPAAAPTVASESASGTAEGAGSAAGGAGLPPAVTVAAGGSAAPSAAASAGAASRAAPAAAGAAAARAAPGGQTGATAGGVPASASSAARTAATQVQLKFASDSWTEVYDADGNRLFYDVAAANSEQTLEGKPPLRVVLGHAPGVSVSVNGRAAPIPAQALRDDGAEFIVKGSGRLAASR